MCSGQKIEFSGKGMLNTCNDFTSTVLETELFVGLSSLFPANLFRFSFMMMLHQFLLRITVPLDEIQESGLAYALSTS